MMKKYLYLTIALFCLYNAPQAHAAITFISTASSSKTSSATSTTGNMTTTIGNLLVDGCLQTGGGADLTATTTVTSTDGTVWTQFANVTGTSFGGLTGFYAIASSTGVVSTTCIYGAASNDLAQLTMQYSGAQAVLDTTSTYQTSTSVTSATTTFSTTNANDVVANMGFANSDGSLTGVSVPFTLRGKKVGLFGFGGADLITSTIQSNQSLNWTFASSPFAEFIGAFKATVTPPASSIAPYCMLVTNS